MSEINSSVLDGVAFLGSAMTLTVTVKTTHFNSSVAHMKLHLQIGQSYLTLCITGSV